MTVAKTLQFFDKRSGRGESLVLATVVATRGSTYSKAGDQMLIGADGVVCGMLSGGCLEGDLAVRSQVTLASGDSQLVEYDLAVDDEVWGLGVGCDGSIEVLLQALTPDNRYQPFADIATILRSDAAAEFDISAPEHGVSLRFVVRPPVRILVLGAGLDAVPLTRIVEELGWRCTITDHRPAYVENPDFPATCEKHCLPADRISASLDLSRIDCAIVMSHHLASDRAYLRQLAGTDIPYVGLLGPPARRKRLLGEIGSAGDTLRERLRSPAGLNLGGRGPEMIALSVVSEMQSILAAG